MGSPSEVDDDDHGPTSGVSDVNTSYARVAATAWSLNGTQPAVKPRTVETITGNAAATAVATMSQRSDEKRFKTPEENAPGGASVARPVGKWPL